MSKPKISLIAAISENRVIGKENTLPWYIPEDLKRFKQITKNHPVIMGRKTYESIGRLLPKRTNIIITRDFTYMVDGAVMVHSLDEAVDIAKTFDSEEIFIIGGGQIFEQAITIADKLYLTIVHTELKGDAFFPEYSEFTRELERKESSNADFKYTFLTLTR